MEVAHDFSIMNEYFNQLSVKTDLLHQDKKLMFYAIEKEGVSVKTQEELYSQDSKLKKMKRKERKNLCSTLCGYE